MCRRLVAECRAAKRSDRDSRLRSAIRSNLSFRSGFNPLPRKREGESTFPVISMRPVPLFQSAPPQTRGRKETSKAAVSGRLWFQSAPPQTRGRKRGFRLAVQLGEAGFNPLPRKREGESADEIWNAADMTRCGFNPLPRKREGESRRRSEGRWQKCQVSIRSPANAREKEPRQYSG